MNKYYFVTAVVIIIKNIQQHKKIKMNMQDVSIVFYVIIQSNLKYVILK